VLPVSQQQKPSMSTAVHRDTKTVSTEVAIHCQLMSICTSNAVKHCMYTFGHVSKGIIVHEKQIIIIVDDL
jgi:hypothetical protein